MGAIGLYWIYREAKQKDDSSGEKNRCGRPDQKLLNIHTLASEASVVMAR